MLSQGRRLAPLAGAARLASFTSPSSRPAAQPPPISGSGWPPAASAPSEIGIINAAPVFALLLINLFVGRLADRASDWRQLIIILSLVAALFPLGLNFVTGFGGILVVWTLFSVPAGRCRRSSTRRPCG